MKKILTITILLLLTVKLTGVAQDSTEAKKQYKKSKLVKAEANFLFSYYQQDGNNAAVTGGLGTELLNNIATNTGFSLVYQGKRENLHSFSFNVGVDSYTSASSDNIDPNTISSASSGDVHVYPSLSWELDNQKKRFTIGANLSYSTEYDYESRGAGISFSKYSPDRNREVSVSLSAFWDQWSLIFPKELRPPTPPGVDEDEDDDYATTPRNSYSASIVYNQVINKRLQVAFLTDVVYQQGWLSTPFHRVYFQGQTQAKIEHLPDTRFKLPFGIRANYFVSDFLILRGYYRYYWDNWGLTAHTLSLEAPFKMLQGLSFYPFARLYTQTQAQYFAPYRQHNLTETFFTSDYDLSGFSSQFVGVGLRLAPPKGILVKPLNALSLRYGTYRRSNGLASNIFTVNLTYKFK